MPLAKKPASEDTQLMGGKKVRVVRGGGICAKGDKPALVRGSLKAATCVSTPGKDPRPRWRVAGQSRG